MQQSAFVPQNITVPLGSTITWHNLDPIAHTSTSDTPMWDSGSMAQGQAFSFTFNTPGVYSYHCTFHPGMTGTITVRPTCAQGMVLIGHVTWQGVTVQPNYRQVQGITLTLKSGASEGNYPVQNTDPSGFFTIETGLPPGIYDWRAKGTKHLANGGSLSLALMAVTSQEMGLQRAGDANNDNVVSIQDFGIIRNSFGRALGEPGYDDRADFTADQIVNASDFNLLRGNFGSLGYPPLAPQALERRPGQPER
jgi:hypothetical protein